MMTEVVIRDVPIKFPFKPYKVQEDYMSKVLECLQERVNGVLESPTGTGKTLSLLCSSLAWQQTKKAAVQAAGIIMRPKWVIPDDGDEHYFNRSLKDQLDKASGSTDPKTNDPQWNNFMTAPQIIYASRTHSQLTQVVNELKRTSYSHVKAAILGSRDQLCLHPDLAEEQGFMKISLCQAKLKSKSCHLYRTNENRKYDRSFLPTEVFDMEDLIKYGKKHNCCPYYMSREMMEEADIVFMPYNYLLNPHTRRLQKLMVYNTVVILDEAHNVEKICEESASFHISSTDIALCIGDVTQAMKIFADGINNDSDEDVERDFTMEDLCVLKTMFLALETVIDEIQLETVKEGYDKGKKVGKTFPGSYIFDLLNKAEIKIDRIDMLDRVLTNVARYLSTTNSEFGMIKKGGMLGRFTDFLNVVSNSCGCCDDTKETDLYYRVYVEPEVPKNAKPDSWSSTKTNLSSTAKIINFWCFSPGFAMRSLLNQGIHCVILTSGTLSPLRATISELGIPIPVQLENPHIIDCTQVNVSVISKGPTREKLISTYANRENPKYLGDMGRMMTNFCRVIPDGVLIFFPSYPTMAKTINHWQQEGFWSQINALKPLFVEPQRRESLNDVMRDFNSALESDGSRGAVLLAVLRGKVSEGMDFADARCRAVIITGLPYPPYKDPRVVLKQEYVNNLRKTNPTTLTGREWYELEATRAVNQAVGRVIRHASDFGAILLCDCRFESSMITNTLSAWLRPHIVKCPEFGPAYGRVTKFFKAMGVNPPVRYNQSGASFDCVNVVKVRIKEDTEKKSQEESNSLSMKKFLENVRQNHRRASPQPSPAGLLDALNTPSSQTKQVDILKATYEQPEEVKESYVQPAPKRRKLKIVPLVFSDSQASTAANTTQEERKQTTLEYLREVRSRINEEKFGLLKEAVKAYAYSKDYSYDKTVLCLRKVFPDSATRDLFLGFKRYIKAEHLSRFEELCLRMYGTT